MRSRITTLLGTAALLALGVGLASLLPASASAQQQPPSTQRPSSPARVDANTVGGWVQRFYDQTRSFSSRFVQRYVNRVHRRTDVSRGRLRIRRPGRLRFDYDRPNGKVIVSNGRRLLVFEPGENNQPGQYFERNLADDQLPSALSFLTGTGRLANDFRFRLLDSRRFGYPTGYVLELRPRRRNPHYNRLLLYVDGNAQRRGVVHRLMIIDGAGNRNRFDFQNQRLNQNIPESTFTYRPPRNARRVRP